MGDDGKRSHALDVADPEPEGDPRDDPGDPEGDPGGELT